MKEKIRWHGVLIAQSRIRLSRSFDQRSHTYLGYSLKVRGNVGTEAGNFSSASGEAVTPNTNSEPETPYPVMRCQWLIRGSRRSNFIRSAI